MIEIKNLYKRYHNHHGSDWVLRDINLTIPSGVSVGLIGGNGAGKSTLLRLIAGMDTPERGEVIRHSRVSWPIGLSGGMQGSMTGRQNVKFVARAQGQSRNVTEIVKFVEDFAEIGQAFDEPVKTYSSGMRSRLSFGLSLSFNFDVYLSDEATSVGDRAFKKKALALFKERVNHSSLIMVSHTENTLRQFCRSAIYLKDKKAFWFDKIDDAIEVYNNDVDKVSEIEKVFSNKEKRLMSHEAELPEDEELHLAIKKLRVHLSGLQKAAVLLDAHGWSHENIAKINKIQHSLQIHIDKKRDLLAFKSKSIEGLRKKESVQAKDAINSIKKLAGYTEILKYDPSFKETLANAEKDLSKLKSNSNNLD